MLLNNSNKDELLYKLQDEGILCSFLESDESPYYDQNNLVHEIATRLLCQNIRSILIVGETWSGKTSLVKHFVKFTQETNIPELSDLKILNVEVSSILSNSEYRGSFEKRANNLFDECSKYSNVIIFFDEAHCLRFTSFKEGLGLMDILKSRIIGSNLRIVLATTNNEAKFLQGR